MGSLSLPAADPIAIIDLRQNSGESNSWLTFSSYVNNQPVYVSDSKSITRGDLYVQLWRNGNTYSAKYIGNGFTGDLGQFDLDLSAPVKIWLFANNGYTALVPDVNSLFESVIISLEK